MTRSSNWWTADHRGAPGWVIVGAALFLIACAGAVVASNIASAPPSASSEASSSDTPFALPIRGTENFVSVLGASSSFTNTQWWDGSVDANEIPGAYPDHVEIYPVAASAALGRHVAAASESTDYVIVQSGTEDVLAGRRPEQAVSALRSVWRKVKQQEAQPIAALVAPSDAMPAATRALNTLIRKTAKAQNVEVLDVYTPVAAADGSWATKMSADGITPNSRASALMTKAAIRQLTALIPTQSD